MVLIFSEAVARRCSVKQFFRKATNKFADKVHPDSCLLIDFPKLFRTYYMSNTWKRLFLYAACKTLKVVAFLLDHLIVHSHNVKKKFDPESFNQKQPLELFYKKDIFIKKIFLKILQNSQENTCAGVSFSIT